MEFVDQAAEFLRAGQLVAFPTETVYGLGANALDETAVGRVFEVKRRPSERPLIVHAADTDRALRWATGVDRRAIDLAEAFWPGPLTLVLGRHPHMPARAAGGHRTIGLRVPDHPMALALLEAAGVPVAAPSANRFGQVSPTRARDVHRALGHDVAMVLDGGDCEIGVESTIIGLTTAEPVLLRPGGLSVEAIEQVLGSAVTLTPNSGEAAPGQSISHYAPRCLVRLVTAATLAGERQALLDDGLMVAVIESTGSSDLDARLLYRRLQEADEDGADVILALPPEPIGIGRAVLDRLQRSAAPRD